MHRGSGFGSPGSEWHGLCKDMGTVSAPGLLSLPPVLHHYRMVLLPDPALFGCGLWGKMTGTVDCGLRFLGGSVTMLVNPMASGVSWAPEWTFELS